MPAAHIGAVKDRQMFVLHMRGVLKGHRTAYMGVCRFDGVLVEAKRLEHVEAVIIQLRVGKAKDIGAERITKGKAVEREFDVKGAFHGRFQLVDLGIAKALVAQGVDRDGLTVFQAAGTHRIADDVVNLRLGIAKVGQCLGHDAVDDLEIATAGQLLEFHDGEIRLDPGGVTIHHQTNGAGRGDHSCLRVAIAMCLALFNSAVPGGAGRIDQCLVGAGCGIQRHRQDAETLIALCLAMRGQPVILHHPDHALGVLVILREGANLAGDLGRCGVGDAGHDGRNRPADGTAFITVIGMALRHQQPADIGKAKAKGAVFIGQLGNFL